MKFPKISPSSLTVLTLVQVLGLGFSTITGSGIWFLIALLARPSDVGILGRVVSTSTFLAGIFTAGLGQFFLASLRTSNSKQFRTYLFFGVVGTSFLSGFLALIVGFYQSNGHFLPTITTGFLCFGIAISNLQDAFYLTLELPFDVPLKGMSILIARLVLLIIFQWFETNQNTLLLSFLLSQLLISIIWLILRTPMMKKRHGEIAVNNTPEMIATSLKTLSFSYLFSMAVSAITMGIPAIFTTVTDSVLAGTFYYAWTCANLLGSISVAVGNSILTTRLSGKHVAKTFAKILVILSLITSFGSLIIIQLLNAFFSNSDNTYPGILPIFRAVSFGFIFYSISVVSFATYRSISLKPTLSYLLISWPVVIISFAAWGALRYGIQAGVVGFAFGSIITALPICFATLRTVSTQKTALKVFS